MSPPPPTLPTQHPWVPQSKQEKEDGSSCDLLP